MHLLGHAILSVINSWIKKKQNFHIYRIYHSLFVYGFYFWWCTLFCHKLTKCQRLYLELRIKFLILHSGLRINIMFFVIAHMEESFCNLAFTIRLNLHVIGNNLLEIKRNVCSIVWTDVSPTKTTVQILNSNIK